MTTAKAKNSWFTMSADAKTGVGAINIFGDIGGFGISFDQFNRELENLGPVTEIKLSINSDGGDVFDGFAIYNALQLHPATKSVTIMGLAASMASVIAMAGDTRAMPANAVMMIHNPVGGILGSAEELISYGEAVGQMRDKIAQTYADASGGKLSTADALALMDKQTWLTAEKALELGLATNLLAPVKMAARFDASRYSREFGIHSNTESNMTTKKPTAEATAAPETPAVETPAVETPAAPDALSTERARVKEINALCRVAGRPDMAAKFGEDGLSVSEVVVALDKLGKPEKELSARHGVDTGDQPPAIDTVAIWNNWNRVK